MGVSGWSSRTQNRAVKTLAFGVLKGMEWFYGRGTKKAPPGTSFISLHVHDGLLDMELATRVPGLGWG